MTNLHDRLDAFPEAWKPKAGDKLVGTVVEVDERDGGFGTYPIIVLTTDEGIDYAVHAFHTVLKKELARQRPVVGDRIGLAYHGKDEIKKYERYRCVVEHATATKAGPDWDAIEKAAEAELATDHDAPETVKVGAEPEYEGPPLDDADAA